MLPTSKSGLSKESVANVSQIITIDKDFLSQQIGKLDTLTMLLVEDGVRLVLGL